MPDTPEPTQTPTRGITAWARAEPDRPAMLLGDEVRTYGALDTRASALAGAFAARGVGADGRVAIMLPNGFEFFETWVAATKVGASVVLVNWHLKTDELAYILGDSGAQVLVAHTDLSEHFGPALAGTPGCELLVVGGDALDPAQDYERAIADVANVSVDAEVSGLASPIFYTSGTTGRPKGVVHGISDPEAAARNMEGQVALWGWTSDDRYILSGPAYHGGPGGWAMAALYVGAPMVLLPAFDARAWLGLVARHGVTCSFMVPSHFIRILEVPETARVAPDHATLRIIVHAGAPCPIDVKHRIIAALAPCEISELYGMSEGGATRISMTEWLERPGSVGTPWPGVEVRILDESGAVVPTGETGMIYVRPPGGMRFQYHDDPDKTAEAWSDDAFTVGDIGHLDADGSLFLTDRAADLVISGGVNVYPREIEEVLHTHPEVVDCAVFGIPDERLGERLHAVVEVRTTVPDDALAAHCREHLADYKVPKSFELVDELPRQPNGKVLKRVLREPHWEGRASRII
ncbi:MAG TPA: AMP-binding protein [Acidimicrobiia bacterium]|nr:AMP-binding protein [Acidimicrobiia bacterium]